MSADSLCFESGDAVGLCHLLIDGDISPNELIDVRARDTRCDLHPLHDLDVRSDSVHKLLELGREGLVLAELGGK
jgi:hypothetical protein